MWTTFSYLVRQKILLSVSMNVDPSNHREKSIYTIENWTDGHSGGHNIAKESGDCQLLEKFSREHSSVLVKEFF